VQQEEPGSLQVPYAPLTEKDETLARIAFRGDTVANPNNVVTTGNARFILLAPRLLRLEWSETGQWEDRATFAFPIRYGPAQAYRTWTDAGVLVVDTGALRLRYRPDGPFSAENLSIAFDLDSVPQTKVWRPGLAGPSNLRGTRRTLDECPGDAALDEGLLSRAGWALFDDSRSVVFDASDGWPTPRPEHECQDWYFFGYGHDYQAALTEYRQFGGPIPLIPRYVLGAWWSRYWAYSDQELEALVGEFWEHDLPLDVLVVDMDWHTPHTWTGYTWNRALFPDPPAFLRWVHDQGLRVTLNLHPAQGVQSFEELYPRFAQAMGVDPENGEAIPFRITDKRFVKHYFELLHRPLERDGVDFWWMDWQQGGTSDVVGLDPLTWINHIHFQDSARCGRRPMLYSRWGGLGNHRYPIGFSGDTYVTWQALQFQPFMTATASNVAYGWWSHDIGGHMGGATEPELYARWVQFGALSPCLRLHATKDALAERRPWKYPQGVYEAAKEAFHLRYRLVPYLYTMARVAHDSGVSLCRPMYYEYPEEGAAYAARYQYFLGDQMIAAPLVFPADPDTGLAATDVWIPEGTWIDYQSREIYAGPRWVRLVGDLGRMPILVKAGAILPMAPAAPTTGSTPHDNLILSVFSGSGGAFRLYEDDGRTEAYKTGQCEWTGVRTRMEGEDAWVVEIDPVQGCCEALPPRRSYEIRLEGSRCPLAVTVDGQETKDWDYEATTLTTTVHVPSRDKQQPVAVAAKATTGILALGEVHNQKLIRRDVRRLLGDRCPRDPLDVDAVLGVEGPGRQDAVARLGGPFVRFVEFLTPEEASQQLGRVIIGSPAGPNQRYAAEMIFCQFRGSDTQTYRIPIERATDSQIMNTPFRHDGELRSSRWEAEVRLSWRGETLTYTYESSSLFPTIHAWRVYVYNHDEQSLLLDEVLDGEGNLNSAIDWRFYRQEDGPPLANLTDCHIVRLAGEHAGQLEAGEPLAGYLATTISSPDDRDAIFLIWAECRTEWYLNGQRIEIQPFEGRETASPPFYRPTRKSAVLRLREGVNSLVAASSPSESIRASTGLPYWRFGGALVSPDGRVMPDLEFGQVISPRACQWHRSR